MEEKKLKPLRLKIRSNGIRHLVIAEDEYLIEGVKRVDIEMPPLEAAMVNIQVYLKDIDLELCGVEQNSDEGKIAVMRGLINESNESEDEIKKNEFYKTEWYSDQKEINQTYLGNSNSDESL